LLNRLPIIQEENTWHTQDSDANVSQPPPHAFDHLPVEVHVDNMYKKEALTIRDIRGFGYQPDWQQYVVLAKLSRKSKQLLHGHSKIWLPMNNFGKSTFLYNLCLGAIQQLNIRRAWKNRLQTVVIGASKIG
jgi:hypothetical protein